MHVRDRDAERRPVASNMTVEIYEMRLLLAMDVPTGWS